MSKINFDKGNGLVPAVIQNVKDNNVLMLGYMNKESFKKTKKCGYVCFWSRSRNKLWLKGETSGNKLKVMEIFLDCDQDTLLIMVELEGNCVCHTGNYSCFFNEL